MSHREFSSVSDALAFLSPGDSLLSKEQSGTGGCINSTYLLQLSRGKSYFTKENNHAPSDMFREESKGLTALSEKFPLIVPRPLALGKEGKKDFLILDFIKGSAKKRGFWTEFAVALAQMHDAEGSHTCGFDSDNYIGSTRQINDKMDKWTDFFCEKRLLYQLKLAVSRNLADSSVIKGVENICHKISSLLPEPNCPSLLHGDLWSGNYMVDEEGRAALIDPAVYYGHREADLAMTELFGGFPREFYDGYSQIYCLDKGYRERRDLYNLYHMLNHLNLFGLSYAGSVKSIISAYS